MLAAGFAAGWIDAVVGGGGLLQLPALLLVPGMSPVQALATNKLASIFGTTTSAVPSSQGSSSSVVATTAFERLLLGRRGHPLGDHELQLSAEQANALRPGLVQVGQIHEQAGQLWEVLPFAGENPLPAFQWLILGAPAAIVVLGLLAWLLSRRRHRRNPAAP